MSDHKTHDQHLHSHGSGCGHTTVKHDDHVDYLHDDHLHSVHGGHVHEHALPCVRFLAGAGARGGLLRSDRSGAGGSSTNDSGLRDERRAAASGHGAPCRLQVETQLGFKMVKWVRSIELVEDYRMLGEGQGGYREDVQFYGPEAGI